MEGYPDRPHFAFLWGFGVGVITQISWYITFFILFVLIGIFISASYNWKREVKDMIEEEKKDIRRNPNLWLANLTAIVSGIVLARLLWWDYV